MRPKKDFVVLAIDLGTSSSRSAIYDKSGNRLMETTAQFSNSLQTGADGLAEIRPTDFARIVKRAVIATLQAYRGKSPIAGIGVSCFWHSLLGVDKKGRPVTPIYTWADFRCRADAELLRRNSDEAAIHARTGCLARASFWPAKLLWLRRTQPQLAKRVARWVSPAEWIQQEWCGTATVSPSMASGTGLLDGRTLRWDQPLLRRCGLHKSQLNPISEAPTSIRPAMVRRFPELRDVPWYPAIGDGAASNLGSGAVAPGVAAINVGTSAALRVVVKPQTDPRKPLGPLGLFAYRIDTHRQLVGGAVSNAGNLRAWALRELQVGDPAQLEKLLRGRPLPVENLTVLPFWMAERAPTWPEDMPSVIMGITQSTTALDLLQTLQESSYHRLAQIADAVEKAARRKLTFIVSGGLQRSPNSLQRLANVLGRTVYPSFEPEASLRGGALFALEQIGCRFTRPALGAAIRPKSIPARAYVLARQRQAQLEKQMQTWSPE